MILFGIKARNSSSTGTVLTVLSKGGSSKSSNMKFLVVFVCALAAASAGYVAPVVYGAQHLPLIGADGVPVDTAEVQHARAAHLVHKVNVQARNGDYLHHAVAPVVAHTGYSAHLAAPVAHHGVYSAPIAHHGVVAHHVPAAYPTTHVLPTSVNGVPLETPEVVAAKVNHFAAHAEALTRNAHALHYRKRRGIYAASPLAYSSVAYNTPIVASTYAHSPLVASTYAHSPLVASTYAHSPLVASTYAHSPLVAASTYAHGYAHPLAYGKYAHYY